MKLYIDDRTIELIDDSTTQGVVDDITSTIHGKLSQKKDVFSLQNKIL